MSLAEELGYSFQSEKCYNPRPVLIRETGEIINRPCGDCLPCLRRRQSEWIVRLREQLSVSFSAYFLTLTYDDDWVPFNLAINHEVLDKRDPINFWRRCRSLIQKGGFIWHDPDRVLPDQPVNLLRAPFKYYMTSEYGPRHNRPHFHAIVFDWDPDFYKVDLLCQKCWPYGFLKLYSYDGDFMKFIGYTTKYLVNNMLCPDERLPRPFSLMSKKLGSSYLDRMFEWHQKDLNRRFSAYEDKKDILPRYYRDRLYNASERALQDAKIRRELDRIALNLDEALTTPELREQFYSERLAFQKNEIDKNLRLMLKKQKIK